MSSSSFFDSLFGGFLSSLCSPLSHSLDSPNVCKSLILIYLDSPSLLRRLEYLNLVFQTFVLSF